MAAQYPEEIEPATIRRIGNAVPPAYAVLAGMRLDLFTPLQHGPLTAEELARVIGADAVRLRSLLYALAWAGLLTVDQGHFANSAEADRFLVRGRPNYLGGLHEWWSVFFSALAKTAASVRTGQAQARHDYAALPSDELAAVMREFHPEALDTGRWLATRFDLTDCQTLADVGGGTGGLALAIADRCPTIQATVVDLPAVEPIAAHFVAEAGGHDRIHILVADLLTGPLPGTFDVAVLKSFVQVFAPEDARIVLRNVGLGVRPGGTLYIVGAVLDDSRLAPAQAVFFNLTALNIYNGGQAYTESEYRTWLEEAGFDEVQFVWGATPTGNSAIVARKLA